MEYYFERYGDLELQRRMVFDRHRTEAFRDAIFEVVRKTDVVLDVGTGTGLLAMLAARAGAKQVFAIDQAEITQTAANLIKTNGLADKVRVFRGSAAELELDQKASLLISEWLGNFAFVESMLDDVIEARNKNLKKTGRMLPSHVSVLLAPMDDAVLYATEGPGGWRDEICELDFSSLEPIELKQGKASQLRIEPGALLAAGQPLFTLDLKTCHADDPWQDGVLEFTARRDGVLSGFCGWFSAQLSPKLALDTSPLSPETHWVQTYLPFPPRPVQKGKAIKLAFSLGRDEYERRHVNLHLQIGRTQQSYTLE